MKFEATKTVIINILVTFVQGAFVAWGVTGFATDKVAIGAVFGAGASAVWNLVVKPFLAAQGWIATAKK